MPRHRKSGRWSQQTDDWYEAIAYAAHHAGPLGFATLCAWLIEVGGPARLVAAAAVFIVGGALVEFWWPGLAVCLMAWAYCRRPSWLRLALWIGALASLYVINRNLWALAALPLIFAAGQTRLNLPRGRLGFYCWRRPKIDHQGVRRKTWTG